MKIGDDIQFESQRDGDRIRFSFTLGPSHMREVRQLAEYVAQVASSAPERTVFLRDERGATIGLLTSDTRLMPDPRNVRR